MSAMNEIPITPLFTKSLALIDDLTNKLQNNQPITSSNSSEKQQQQKKEQKPKQQQQQPKKAAKPTHPFHQTFLVVAQVASIEKHPESEKLYKITLDIGNEKKGLVAGLRKYYTEEELLNRKLITITNLKPRKLAGVLSEAMILAGTSASDENVVKILDPPATANLGDRVVLSTDVNNIEPYVQSIEERCSPNQWEKLVKELKVLNSQPSVSGTSLTLLDGSIIKCELPDGSEIH